MNSHFMVFSLLLAFVGNCVNSRNSGSSSDSLGGPSTLITGAGVGFGGGANEAVCC